VVAVRTACITIGAVIGAGILGAIFSLGLAQYVVTRGL
jgi:ABC-type proline/glycine betaine transport system permease subunit